MVPRSSVVPGSKSASSVRSPGSACQRCFSCMKVFQGMERGFVARGTSSATGRPLSVTRMRSPASTRRSTALTSLRSSRAGTSDMDETVAVLLHMRNHSRLASESNGGGQVTDQILEVSGELGAHPSEGGALGPHSLAGAPKAPQVHPNLQAPGSQFPDDERGMPPGGCRDGSRLCTRTRDRQGPCGAGGR